MSLLFLLSLFLLGARGVHASDHRTTSWRIRNIRVTPPSSEGSDQANSTSDGSSADDRSIDLEQLRDHIRAQEDELNQVRAEAIRREAEAAEEAIRREAEAAEEAIRREAEPLRAAATPELVTVDMPTVTDTYRLYDKGSDVNNREYLCGVNDALRFDNTRMGATLFRFTKDGCYPGTTSIFQIKDADRSWYFRQGRTNCCPAQNSAIGVKHAHRCVDARIGFHNDGSRPDSGLPASAHPYAFSAFLSAAFLSSADASWRDSFRAGGKFQLDSCAQWPFDRLDRKCLFHVDPTGGLVNVAPLYNQLAVHRIGNQIHLAEGEGVKFGFEVAN